MPRVSDVDWRAAPAGLAANIKVRHLQWQRDRPTTGQTVALPIPHAYNRRSRIEAELSRFKRVIGDGLRSHHDERRTTEVKIAVKALNRMTRLGRPDSIKIA